MQPMMGFGINAVTPVSGIVRDSLAEITPMTHRNDLIHTGGCQCGAVRYEVRSPLEMVHYCHCRMCQRAVGNAFTLLAGAPRDRLVWLRNEPKQFDSSSLAQRGFCEACGTPISVAFHESQFTWLMVGTLDRPELAVPEHHYGIESAIPWLHIVDDLPREPTLDDPRYMTMIVHQQSLSTD